MSVSRKTADDFRARVNNGLPAKLLRNQPGAVRGSIWTLAADALEQLAKPPRPGLVARLKSRVAELGFAVRDLERERDKQPPATVTDVIWKHEAIRRAEQIRTIEAIVSRALDLASDYYDPDADPVLQALADELHRAGLYDAEDGSITPAGHALQLRAATTAPAPSGFIASAHDVLGPEAIKEALLGVPQPEPPAPRPLRVYVAGGSSEAVMVRGYMVRLKRSGVEITYDWTADVIRWRGAGCPPLTAEQRAAHARADLAGIERSDIVWWILPAALSEGSAFEAGFAYGMALARLKAEPPDTPFCDPGCECPTCLAQPHTEPRLVVSGDRAAHGRVFPELAAERWESHDAARAAIVSLAAAHRNGDQIPTS